MSNWILRIPNSRLGVRRMKAVVGQEAPFDHGRQQMKLLADLEVTTKAVEQDGGRYRSRYRRTPSKRDPASHSIGSAAGGWANRIPILYVQMDGTGIPVVKKSERWVGTAGEDGRPAGAYEGGQVGVRVHPDQLGPGRLSHP